MKIPSKKRVTLFAALLVLVVVILPYAFSRFAAPSNRLTTIRLEDNELGSNEFANKPVTESALPLTVACYNIAHGRGLAESNWEGGDAATRLQRLDAIAKLLIEIDADVVVLNEIDIDTSWSNNVNQVEYLMKEAGYAWGVHCKNLDFRVVHRTWRIGNAILSRHKIFESREIDLPSFAQMETLLAGKKRGLACDIQVGDQTIRVIGVHFSHRSENVREQSAQAVLRHMATSPHPCIIAGDMNSTPVGFPRAAQTEDGRNAIKTLDSSQDLTRNHPADPPLEEELTFPSNAPIQIIDWIYVSKPIGISSYEVVPATLSDHLPVVAELEW